MESVYRKDLVEIFKLTPNLYYRQTDIAKSGQCCGAFLVGEGGVTAIEAPHLGGAAQMKQEAAELFQKPITRLILTHSHPDHAGSLADFLDTDITVFMSQRFLDHLEDDAKKTGATFVGVKDCLRASLGGIDIEMCIPLERMHSPDDMYIRLSGTGYVISGDLLIQFREFYPLQANLHNWMHGLLTLFPESDRYFLAGHGGVFPREYIGTMVNDIKTITEVCMGMIRSLAREEIEHITADKVNTMIDDFLVAASPEAQLLQKEIPGQTVKKLRLTMWHLLHNMIERP